MTDVGHSRKHTYQSLEVMRGTYVSVCVYLLVSCYNGFVSNAKVRGCKYQLGGGGGGGLANFVNSGFDSYKSCNFCLDIILMMSVSYIQRS